MVETEEEEPGLMTMVLVWMIIATVPMMSHNPTPEIDLSMMRYNITPTETPRVLLQSARTLTLTGVQTSCQCH